MRTSSAKARDAGLELIGRINRWLVAGAVVVTGAVSVAAARSFHGHSTAGTSSAVSQSSGSGSVSSSSGAASSSTGVSGLQQPAQAPSSSSSSPAPVVSGGS